LLADLADSAAAGLEPLLRAFELDLLQALGLCPDLTHDAFTHAPLLAGLEYRYLPEVGFALTRADAGALTVSGQVLLAMAGRDFSAPGVLPAAKRLNRALLEPLLGARPLASRSLFAAHAAAAPTPD